MAAYLQVVLRESMKNLGKSGDLVRVRPGFARNYLVPRQLAVYATEKNVARLEHEKREALARAAKLKGEFEALAKKLSGVVVKIGRRVGNDDRMYGSVTTKDVAEELAKLGHEVDRRKIDLGDGIKALGTFDATIRFAPEVAASFKVEVAKALASRSHQRPLAPRGTSCAPGRSTFGVLWTSWGRPVFRRRHPPHPVDNLGTRTLCVLATDPLSLLPSSRPDPRGDDRWRSATSDAMKAPRSRSPARVVSLRTTSTPRAPCCRPCSSSATRSIACRRS